MHDASLGSLQIYVSVHNLPSYLQIKQPILFLSGLQDEMVPPVHMQLLYAKAAAHNRHCLFVEFLTGMHMDTWVAGGDHYWKTIQQFLEEHVPEKKENESSRNRNGNLIFKYTHTHTNILLLASFLPLKE